MRISDFQRKAILESVTEEFGDDAKVFLFGSRTNDKERGGDIDLLVEVPKQIDDSMRKKLRIMGRIQRQIGEQKIDLIITHSQEFNEENLPLIIKNARREGILL